MSEYFVDLGFEGRRMIQDDAGYCFNSDSVILANLVNANSRDTSVDLGAGSGVISLILALKKGVKKVYGLEIDEKSCDIARRNAELNGINGRVEIICSDVRDCGRALGFETANVVVCNPPYFEENGNAKGKLASSKIEGDAKLEDFIAAGKKLLRFGGEFYLVQKISRLVDVLSTMREQNIEPKHITFLQPTPLSGADAFVVRGKKGAAAGLTSDILTLKNADGSESESVKKLYS